MLGRLRQLVLAAMGAGPVPSSGRVTLPMREDSVRTYVSEGLTPRTLTTLLHRFDDGDLAAGIELAEQMEEKDAHLYSVANTRRLALTGLPWEVVSAADIDGRDDRAAADEARDYCREVLGGIENFDAALTHLSLAVGRNISVCEIVWEGSELADLVIVPSGRLTLDAMVLQADQTQPPATPWPVGLRILTAQDRTRGIELQPAKWMVHTPLAVGGTATRGGLLRLSAACYVAKAFGMKDWLVFIELFGMPVRIGRYEPSATPKDKTELLDMLSRLGSDAAGVFSKAVELELVEVADRGNAPYEGLARFLNAELSKAWLGQTLTTEQGDRGSQALGRVQNEVRQDIRDCDIRAEGFTVRRDLLTPLAQGKFGPDVPVPYFRRNVNDGAAESIAFHRDLVRLWLGNKVTSAMVANLTNFRELLTQVEVPTVENYEEPWLPVRDDTGALVSGEVIKDAEGDVVGGGVIAGSAPALPTFGGAGGAGERAAGFSPSARAAVADPRGAADAVNAGDEQKDAVEE